MTRQIKLAVYALLIIGAVCCGYGFSHGFAQVSANPGDSALTNQPAATAPAADPAKVQKKTRMMWAAAGLIVCTVGLGLLVAYDVSHLVGEKVEEFIWEGEGEEYRTPEYEHAEGVWANGQHLEAIQLMRDYLKTHPREQYVALRIAEIYEKDLHNYLAAALEYEEVLKKPLPPERWGWSAVHLANLYSGKLDRPAEAHALLCRIVNEHPETAAATKARRRLGDQAPGGRQDITEQTQLSVETPLPTTGSLPRGFRPKA